MIDEIQHVAAIFVSNQQKHQVIHIDKLIVG
jgi:hypothetical protein